LKQREWLRRKALFPKKTAAPNGAVPKKTAAPKEALFRRRRGMRYQPVPSSHDAASAESDLLSLPTTDTGEAVVAAVAGEFGACDVWFAGPENWLAASHAVVVRLYARQGSARVMIGQVNLLDVLHTEDPDRVSSAWVFSARGVEAQGLEVSCQRGSGGVNLTDGRFFLRAKTSAAEPAILGAGGLPGLKAVTVSNIVQVQPAGAVTVTQSQASALSATVVQGSAAALQTTAAQGGAGAAAARWPVYLSDGSAAQGTTGNPLYIGRIRDGAATFAAASGLVGTGTTVTTKSLAYLWHPSSSTKRVEIRRIRVSYFPGVATGTVAVLFRAVRITAVSGSPGGTTLTASALDLSDSTSLTLMTGATAAPTRPAASQADVFALALTATSSGVFEWRAADWGKPIVMRASSAEGLEVLADVKGALTTQMQAAVNFEWVEI